MEIRSEGEDKGSVSKRGKREEAVAHAVRRSTKDIAVVLQFFDDVI